MRLRGGTSHVPPIGTTTTTAAFGRGYDLYTTSILPKRQSSTACLVFHHGLSDHTARHLKGGTRAR